MDEEKNVKKEEKPVENKKEIKKEEKKVAEEKNNNKTKEEKKKFDNVKKDKKDSKKGNVALIIAIIAIIAIVVIALVVFMADSPKKVVNQIFLNVKDGNIDENVISEIMQGENVDEETKKSVFNNLTWKINKEEIKGNDASVEVEVTNKDFKAIIDNLKEKIVSVALSGETIDEAKTQKYLLEEINNSKIENVTTTHNIKLKKQDGKWQITEENDIVDIFLPGLNE